MVTRLDKKEKLLESKYKLLEVIESSQELVKCVNEADQ